MSAKEFDPASYSETHSPPDVEGGTQDPLYLDELSRRQQAAIAKLTETTGAFDTLLEETITSVDESMTESDKINVERKDQAAEQAAAIIAEAQVRAQETISKAEADGKAQSQMALTKVGELIEEARSSAGQAAKSCSDQKSTLTEEIWTALEASIGQSLQSLLKELEILAQETTSSADRETARETSASSR